MPDTPGVKRRPRNLVFGIVLITFGLLLLLDRLNVLPVRWESLVWMVGVFTGGFLVVDGFMNMRRARIFWGGVLFFFSLYWVLARLDIIYHHGFFVTPVILISFGIAFFLLYASDTNEFGLLFPAVLLTGVGAAMLLWWLEYFEWYEVRCYVETYWPLLLIIWGAAILLRKKKTVDSLTTSPAVPAVDTKSEEKKSRKQTRNRSKLP